MPLSIQHCSEQNCFQFSLENSQADVRVPHLRRQCVGQDTANALGPIVFVRHADTTSSPAAVDPSKSGANAFYNPISKPLSRVCWNDLSCGLSHQTSKLQSSIKNLDVYLDSTMSFDKQVYETCKACYFHIRALRHFRASLTPEAFKTIAAAIIGS